MLRVTDPLTAEHLRKILNYDRDTGLFTWKMGNKRMKAGTPAGRINPPRYGQIKINNIAYSSHRLAWLYVYGEFPKNEIDHINRVKTDNRISNLRDVPHTENMRNCGLSIRNRSGKAGVSFKKETNKWISWIFLNGKKEGTWGIRRKG